MQVDHRGSAILGGLCVPPQLDSTLRTHFRAVVWLAEEGAKVRVGRGALGGGSETKGDADGGTGSPESRVQDEHIDLCNGRHESDQNRMGDQLGG